MPTKTSMPLPVIGSLFHKPSTASYPAWGGPEGLRHAHALGADAIDVDLGLSSDEIPVAAHSPDLAKNWRDPLDRIGPAARIDGTPWAVLARLEATPRDARGYRMHSLAYMLKLGGELGMTLCLEAKGDPRFEDVAVWREIRRHAEAHHCRIVAMALPDIGRKGGGYARLAAAHAAGVPTLLLTRARVAASHWDDLDFVKGPRRWTDHGTDGKRRPSRVRRLGGSWKDATRWGCSVGPGDVRQANAVIRGDQPRKVGPVTRPPKPRTYAPPAPPMIPARWHGGSQTPRDIVIHGTVSPCAVGDAKSVAEMFANEGPSNKTSAHYVVDPAAVYQCVPDHTVGYHCGHNQDSIGIELCDPQAGRRDRWSDTAHEAMLARAANLVARLCLAYNIPVHRIGVPDLLAGRHGECGHVDESNAFHQSTHTDPGPDFPWPHFMDLVEAQVTAIKNGA